MFQRENYFLQFLAYGKDKKQKYYIIKHINKFQYNLLRKIAVNILTGEIPLNKTKLQQLKKFKLVIRQLSEGKLKLCKLTNNYSIIVYMVKISLQYYEVCSKISTSSNRRVGKSESKRYEFKRSTSSTSESNESRGSEGSEISSGCEKNTERNGREEKEEYEISDISLPISEEEE